MADSNPYSLLDEEIDSDLESFSFKSLVPDAKIVIPNGDLEETTFRSSPSLLACSSTFGYLVAGNCSGFVLVETKRLRAAIYKTGKGNRTPLKSNIQVEISEGKVRTVNLSQDQLQILVGISGGKVLVFNVHDIVVKKGIVQPVQTIDVGAEIAYIRSDSKAHPDIIAVNTNDNECKIIQYMTNQVLCTYRDSTCIAWSPSGKQIACGSKNGSISIYDVEGHKLNEIQAPELMQVNRNETVNRFVNGILWIHENVFLAVYARPKKDTIEYDHTPYIINTKCQDMNERYFSLEEITPIFSDDIGPDSHFYFEIIRNFGPNTKTIIICGNSGSTTFSVIGENNSNNWTVLSLENGPSSPLTDEYMDTYPIGITVDFSASEPLPPFDAAEDETPVAPFPVLFFSNNEGVISSYHIYDSTIARSGQKYQGMVDAQDVNSIPLPALVTPITKQSTSASAATEAGFNAPPKIPLFSTLPQDKQESKEEKQEPTPAVSEQTKFGTTSGFGGQPLGFGAPMQTTPFSNLQISSSDKTKKLPGTGFGSSFGSAPTFGASSFGSNTPGMGAPLAFGGFKNVKMDSSTLSGAKSFDSATPSTGAPPAFGGFKSVKIDNSNLFGAKSFASDSSPSSSMFAPSILNSTQEPEAGKSAFETPKDNVRKSAFGVPNVELDVPKKANDDGCSLSFEDVQRTIGDDPSVSKKSSDDFSFEEVKRSIDDDSSSDASTRISSIHDDEFNQEQPQSSDELSESSGVHITKDQLSGNIPLHEEGQLNEEDQLDEEEPVKGKSKEEQEAEAAEKKKKEEEEKKKKEEEAAALKKKQEEEEVARRKAEEEEAVRRKAEEERLEQEKAEAQRREKERMERERIEAEKREQERIERERLEAIENTCFAHVVKKDKPVTLSERSTGLHPLAEKFENEYFETNEELAWNHNTLEEIRENLDIQQKSPAPLLDTAALANQQQEWRLGHSEDISVITETMIKGFKEATVALNNASKKFKDLRVATDRLLDRQEIITDYVDAGNFDEPLNVDICEELKIQYKDSEERLQGVETKLKSVESKENEIKQKLNKPTRTNKKEENISTSALRRTIRDIDVSLKTHQKNLMKMEEEELNLSFIETKSEKYLTRISQRQSFLDAIVKGVQSRHVVNV